ncbi:hypothetical protein ACFOY2_10650 [Nonomuraea purpurea]|uniref:Uncharacterized protein n=1 Tax=Nonomuraea purpurea TaxID=1849276 RepID=A0ABV8G126_9ACTN
MTTVLVAWCDGEFGPLTALTPARRGDRAVATVRDPDSAGIRERSRLEALGPRP